MNREIVSLSFDRFPAPKGAAVHIEQFATALGMHFGNVHLLTVPQSVNHVAVEDEWTAHGLRHTPIPAPGRHLFERVLAFRRGVRRWWRRQFSGPNARARVVHFRSIFEGYPIVRERRRFAERVVFEVNGLPSIELKYRYPQVADDQELMTKLRTQERVCLERADRIITVSEVNRRHLQSRGVPADRITVIPNGVDPGLFPQDQVLRERCDRSIDQQHPLTVLYVGTVSAWQGVRFAIDAVGRLNQEFPTRMLIVGSIRERERRALFKQREKHGLTSDRFHLATAQSQAELRQYYAESDVVLAPLTRNDRNCDQGCCPLKVIEAMASGVPLVASNLEVVRELAENHVHAKLVKPGSGRAISDAVLEILVNPIDTRAMVQRARRHALSEYVWNTANRRLVKLYEELLDSPSR